MKISSFLKSGEFSDVTLIFGQTTLKAHKVVLCSQSKFFSNACRLFKEAEENVITLVHGGETLLKDMIHFLYRGHSPLGPDNKVLGKRPFTGMQLNCRTERINPVYYAGLYSLAGEESSVHLI